MDDNLYKPYYVSQDDWSVKEYYSLHRYLHRLILHANRKKYEITQLDIQKMSDKTRVLLYCIIVYYHCEQLFALSNLRGLKDCKPLSEPLVLSEHGLMEERVYSKMNVIL